MRGDRLALAERGSQARLGLPLSQKKRRDICPAIL
jgi:hypothetical protein